MRDDRFSRPENSGSYLFESPSFVERNIDSTVFVHTGDRYSIVDFNRPAIRRRLLDSFNESSIDRNEINRPFPPSANLTVPRTRGRSGTNAKRGETERWGEQPSGVVGISPGRPWAANWSRLDRGAGLGARVRLWSFERGTRQSLPRFSSEQG